MINSIVNSVINTCTSILFESKEQISEAVKKKSSQKANTLKIPSPQDFKYQLEAIRVNDQKSLLKAEAVYNNFNRKLTKLINKTENSRSELIRIKEKLEKIESLMGILNNIVEIITPVIDLIKGTIVPGIDTLLAAQVSPIISGLTVNRLDDDKKKIQEETKKAEDSIESIPLIFSFFNEQISELKTPLEKGISGLTELIDYLKSLLAQLNAFYQQFIENNGAQLNDDFDIIFGNSFSTTESPFVPDRNNNTSPAGTIISDLLEVDNNPIEEESQSRIFKKFKQ
tara:strand:- start:3038 stop:3889 length:852 start_codon:yes stop_codon:yes gene_type:complete